MKSLFKKNRKARDKALEESRKLEKRQQEVKEIESYLRELLPKGYTIDVRTQPWQDHLLCGLLKKENNGYAMELEYGFFDRLFDEETTREALHEMIDYLERGAQEFGL